MFFLSLLHRLRVLETREMAVSGDNLVKAAAVGDVDGVLMMLCSGVDVSVVHSGLGYTAW